MRNYAAEQLAGRLTRLAFEVRRATRNRRPEDVHDLRVSIRRFLECLAAFREHFPSREAKKSRRRLRRVMNLAAEVRNRDVAIELIEQVGVGPRSAVFGWLSDARGKAMDALVDELRGLNRREFSRRWRGSLELSGQEPRDSAAISLDAAAKYASSELPSLARKFFKRGRRAAAPAGTPKVLHEFRLAAKRFRYAAELFRPVYGPGLTARLGELRSVQQHLGEVNDCATACELLGRAPESMSRPAASAARSIEALSEHRVRAFRLYWKKELDSPQKEQNWISYLTRFAGRKPAPRRS
jgi:CHAD domain-containing protein